MTYCLLPTWQSQFRFDEQQKEWIIDTVKKYGKENIYLDENGNWIDFEAGLIAESKAKGTYSRINLIGRLFNEKIKIYNKNQKLI